jgi:hypothetical protein
MIKISTTPTTKQMIAAKRFRALPRAWNCGLARNKTTNDHKAGDLQDERATADDRKDPSELGQDDPPDDEDPPSGPQPAAQCNSNCDEQRRVHQIRHDRNRQHRHDVVPLPEVPTQWRNKCRDHDERRKHKHGRRESIRPAIISDADPGRPMCSRFSFDGGSVR